MFKYITKGYYCCTDFVSIKKQIEGDKEIAKELQDGNKSDSRTENQD